MGENGKGNGAGKPNGARKPNGAGKRNGRSMMTEAERTKVETQVIKALMDRGMTVQRAMQLVAKRITKLDGRYR